MNIEINDVLGVGEMLKEPVGNLLNPPAKIAGQGIANLLDVFFVPLEIAKICKDEAIKVFKDLVIQGANNIPEDKRIDPQINIIGPALEASKYYVGQPEIRLMFANLICNSMNIDIVDIVHPAFIEVIKQMSPLDATNFLTFKCNPELGIVKFGYNDDAFNDYTLITDLYLEGSFDTLGQAVTSRSISSLQRLGLIEITYSEQLDSIYYVKHNQLKEKLLSDSVFFKKFLNLERTDVIKDIDVTEGIIGLTPFGKQFISACLC